MIVYIMTDIEGLAGIDHWDQCYDPDDESPQYQYGREQLTAEANAAVAGCFDAGAAEVRICDEHGRNNNHGFISEKLDPWANRVWISQKNPMRLEGLDESVSAVCVIGQHAMAGTVNGFLDHTQQPMEICRFLVNGEEQGELGQLALYAGTFNVAVVHVSGDEACCAEARRLLSNVGTTPTKQGTSWATCQLDPVAEARERLRADFAESLSRRHGAPILRPSLSVTIECEWSCSKYVDSIANILWCTSRTRTHCAMEYC